jgi:hypothetical protein
MTFSYSHAILFWVPSDLFQLFAYIHMTPAFYCLLSAQSISCLFFCCFISANFLINLRGIKYNFSVAWCQAEVTLQWNSGSLSWLPTLITKRARPRFCLSSIQGLWNWRRTYFVSGCPPTVVYWLLPSWTVQFKYFLWIHSRWRQGP